MLKQGLFALFHHVHLPEPSLVLSRRPIVRTAEQREPVPPSTVPTFAGGALPRGSRESTVLGPGPGGHVNEDTSVYDHLFFIRPFIPFAFNLIRGVVMHGTLGVLGRGAAPQRLLGAAPRGAATNMEARGNLHQASGDLTSAEVPEVPATATPTPGRGATPGLAVGRRRRHGTMKRLCTWWLC